MNRRVKYLDRKTGEIRVERVMGGLWMRLAYETLAGRLLTSKLLFGSVRPSAWLGKWFDSSLSRRSIPGTIRNLGINIDECVEPEGGFRSFNDFFVRHLKPGVRPFDPTPGVLVSPAEGRISVWPDVASSDTIRVKGIDAPIGELFGGDLAGFDGGDLFVARLCPADYHRFHFPCDGTRVGNRVCLPGRLDSVHPVALSKRPRIFVRNQRQYELFDGPFGRFVMMEIGAFGVGGIVQTHRSGSATKMEEKGYFRFGGSTVLLVFHRGSVEFDSDLVANTRNGLETLVRVGERIGAISGSSEVKK
jgi:phosphatidylserine decarboxylase